MKVRWGHKGRALIRYDWCCYKKGKRCQGCLCTDKRPSELSARRCPSVTQEERPQEKPNLPTLWSWTFNLQNCEKISSCCLSPRVCGILLWLPWQTNTGSKVDFQTETLEGGVLGRHRCTPDGGGAHLWQQKRVHKEKHYVSKFSPSRMNPDLNQPMPNR